MSIKILEQGIWPQDKPSEENRQNIYRWDVGMFEGCYESNITHGDQWIVLSPPEKALEEMTEAELIEKWVAKFPDEAISFRPEFGTYREALIKALK